ncbi:hypothetical protein ACFV23_35870, partial [Streptomyces sp. NPDC059627]
MPGYGTGRELPRAGASGAPQDELDEDVEFWGLLYLDPLLELRLLTAETTGRTELAPGARPPGEALSAAAPALTADDRLRRLLDAAGLEEDFAAAVAAVLTTDDCRRFLRAPAEDAGTAELARAFVAEAVRRRTDRQGPAAALDGTARDEVVARIAALLPGPSTTGDEPGTHRGPVTRRIKRLTGRLALGLASAQAVRRRSALTDAAHPAAGDVLLYLARGRPTQVAHPAPHREAVAPRVVSPHPHPGRGRA